MRAAIPSIRLIMPPMHEHRVARAVSDHGSRGASPTSSTRQPPNRRAIRLQSFLVEDCARSRFGNALMQREFLRDPPAPFYLRYVVCWSRRFEGNLPLSDDLLLVRHAAFAEGASKPNASDAWMVP